MNAHWLVIFQLLQTKYKSKWDNAFKIIINVLLKIVEGALQCWWTRSRRAETWVCGSKVCLQLRQSDQSPGQLSWLQTVFIKLSLQFLTLSTAFWTVHICCYTLHRVWISYDGIFYVRIVDKHIGDVLIPVGLFVCDSVIIVSYSRPPNLIKNYSHLYSQMGLPLICLLFDDPTK